MEEQKSIYRIPIELLVENKTKEPQQANIFSSAIPENNNLLYTTAKSSVYAETHEGIKKQLSEKHFTTSLIRLSCNREQAKNKINVIESDSRKIVQTINPEEHINEEVGFHDIVDLPFRVQLNGNCELETIINPETYCTFDFLPRINP